MNITIKVGGPLRKKVEGHNLGLMVREYPAGTRVSDVIYSLGLGLGDIRVLMKNGRAIKGDDELVDGDRLGLFPRQLAFNVITAISFFNPLAREEKKEE